MSSTSSSSSDGGLYVAMALLFIATYGDPDLMAALINYLVSNTGAVE